MRRCNFASLRKNPANIPQKSPKSAVWRTRTFAALRTASAGCIRGGIMERKSALLASSALTTSIAFISGSALAADMPVKAPVKAPVVAAPFSWSGCYIGGNVGGAWAHVDQPVVENQVDQSSGRSSSVIAGGQAGCNWQFTPSWVFGVEGDFNWLDLKRSSHTFRAGTLPGEDVA